MPTGTGIRLVADIHPAGRRHRHPPFTALAVTSDAGYTLALTVSDGTHSRTDTVVITVLDATYPTPTPMLPPAPPPGRTTIPEGSGDVVVHVPPLAAHIIALSPPSAPASTGLSGSVTVHTSYWGVPISVQIPANATAAGPSGWGGEITLPASPQPWAA